MFTLSDLMLIFILVFAGSVILMAAAIIMFGTYDRIVDFCLFLVIFSAVMVIYCFAAYFYEALIPSFVLETPPVISDSI